VTLWLSTILKVLFRWRAFLTDAEYHAVEYARLRAVADSRITLQTRRDISGDWSPVLETDFESAYISGRFSRDATFITEFSTGDHQVWIRLCIAHGARRG
jgi:hypothetical protein